MVYSQPQVSSAASGGLASAVGFPQAEWSQLQYMSQNGQLNGVDPGYLVAIWVAEGSNTTDAINPQGYGGWFGTTDGSGSFQSQASLASSIYAAGLQVANGDPVGAENYYQTGSTGSSADGAGVFTQYINDGYIPGSTSGYSVTGPAITQTGNPGNLGSGVGTGTAPITLMGDCYAYGQQKNQGKNSCLISPPGGWCFTACEAKALLSALIMVGGVIVMGVGVAVLAGSTKAAKIAGALGLATKMSKPRGASYSENDVNNAYATGLSEGKSNTPNPFPQGASGGPPFALMDDF